MKAKSEISVRKATELAFYEMPDVFTAITLCHNVRSKTGRFSLMDGTILRRLREARADSLSFQYRCIDTEKALYQKQPVI